MNWFKRYGIVGAYFLSSTTLWSKSLVSLSLTGFTEGQQELVVGLFVFTFLPIGYIVSVISQWLYYKKFGGYCIHQKFIKNDLDDTIRKRHNLEKMYSEESTAESILTCRVRLGKNELERIKYLAEQITKRFDVISINKAIILSTILSPFMVLILPLFISRVSIQPNCWRSIFMFLISMVGISLLMAGNSVLYKQIRIINKEILSKEDWEKKTV